MVPALSNVGVLSFDDRLLGVPIRHAMILPPINYPPATVVMASTFRDSLTLAAGFSAGCHDPALVQRLVDGMDITAYSAA
jgi:hypothetical protein